MGVYRGLLSFKEQCEHCHVAFAAQDIGDGPSYISLCIDGFIVMMVVLAMEYVSAPDLWLYILLVPTMSILLSLVSLRILRVQFLYLEYHHHKEEFLSKK